MAGPPESLRAARHIALPQLGADGQARIDAATILLIGIGGIGCAAAAYLASSGAGHLLLSDFDTVDETNLGRQFLYGPHSVGKMKVAEASRVLGAANPDIEITPIPDRLSEDALIEAISRADIVLDGSDNFATRFQVSDACVASGTCLVTGSAIRFEGQLAVFGPDYGVSPCYRCLYREADESLDNCAGNGVLSPVPGVIGTLMAVDTLKQVAGLSVDPGLLRLYDAMSNDWQQVRINKRSDCPACAQ